MLHRHSSFWLPHHYSTHRRHSMHILAFRINDKCNTCIDGCWRDSLWFQLKLKHKHWLTAFSGESPVSGRVMHLFILPVLPYSINDLPRAFFLLSYRSIRENLTNDMQLIVYLLGMPWHQSTWDVREYTLCIFYNAKDRCFMPHVCQPDIVSCDQCGRWLVGQSESVYRARRD